MTDLRLRSLEDSDLPILTQWLYTKHVSPWYQNPDEWLDEISNRHSLYRFIHHYIVMLQDIPIGFCQYYDCYFAKEDWYTVSAPSTLFSIDYLIGDISHLHKGYGRQIVRTLTQKIKDHESFVTIIVRPEPDNIASINTVRSAGYRYDAAKDYYYYSPNNTDL